MFQLDAVFHTDHGTDAVISSLTGRFAFLALVAAMTSILAVNTVRLIVSLAPVEAIKDKTGCYGQLG